MDTAPIGAHAEEPEPIIKDNRRIDPLTGKVRDPSAGRSAGRARSRAGTPRPTRAIPNDAAQPLTVDLSAAELDLARQEAAERTADLQRVTAEYANYRKRVDRDRESVVAAAKAHGGHRSCSRCWTTWTGRGRTATWSVRSARSPTS